MSYAGFWRRFAAAIIDGIVLNLLLSPLMGLMMFNTVTLSQDTLSGMSEEQVLAMIMPVFTMALAAALIGFILQIVYFAYMESSKYQATLGKLALGIVVTDADGNRISFGRAAGRNIGKVLSGLILMFGYIMAAFTARKQALHDILAGTLVMRREAVTNGLSSAAGPRVRDTGEYLPHRYEDDRYQE